VDVLYVCKHTRSPAFRAAGGSSLLHPCSSSCQRPWPTGGASRLGGDDCAPQLLPCKLIQRFQIRRSSFQCASRPPSSALLCMACMVSMFQWSPLISQAIDTYGAVSCRVRNRDVVVVRPNTAPPQGGGGGGRSKLFFFFFLFIHYSHATYGDHGENMYSPFPVRCPRSDGSLQAPLLPSAQACPENLWCAPRKLQKELQKKEGEMSDCVGPRKAN